MPHFKDPAGALHFLSREDVENGGARLLPDGCTEITEAAAAKLQAKSAQKTSAVGQAKIELRASDLVALRCMKAGVEFPAAWRDYCAALRSIVAAGIDTAHVPTPPEYPANT